jgi:serine/threonine-protein kinase
MVKTQELLSSALRGRYSVLREIGSGAMATVYLAEDLRHDRKVAIKVLKPDLAEILGAERFLTEIRTTANLQHPHILPLFDSGDADGFLFYVMPYVAGESLRHRIAREKQLPVSDAVMIASAVASALDHAHRHGVIHRDVKPGNILLHEGQPLVADFGIALAVSRAGGDRLTESRFSLGTPRYMSPEQASGERHIDGRSDLFALGSVTYEMLAGGPPFTAPTTPALIAGILSQTPEPLSQRRPTVPRNVSAAVAKSLEKLPADRFESGAQFARALEDDSFRWPPAASSRALLRNRALVASLALAVVMSALALWTWLRPTSSLTPIPTVRLALTLPDDQFLPVGLSRSVLELSPDGRHLVYVGQRGRETQLYIRTIADFEVRALPGTRNAREPFFSPDGESVAFFADGKLNRIRLDGGSPLEITETPGVSYGGHWGEDGTILYSLGDSSLWRVPADGGSTPTELPLIMTHLGPDRPIQGASRPLKWPRFLPDGRHALVTAGWLDLDGRPNQAGLVGVVDLDTREFRPLLEGSRPVYVRSGHIVFDAGLERIHAVPFDLDRLQVTGPVQSLADNALRSGGSGANFTVSSSGVLAYPTGGFDRTLVIVDRNGRETPLNVPPRGYRMVHASPAGRYVAVTVDPQPPHIWVVDLERERASPLTTDGYNLSARWSQDGSRLAFVRLDVDSPGVYTMRWPDGGAPVLVYPTEDEGGPQWANDTELLLQSGGDIALLDTRTRTTTRFLDTHANERFPALSPDGKWLAYTSNVTGTDEVYVVSFPEKRALVLVSSGGGAEPRWSRDGTELFFRNGNTILSVRTRTTPNFEVAGAVQHLFTAAYDFSSSFNWDILPDARFVMVKSSARTGREIRFVFNWIDSPG